MRVSERLQSPRWRWSAARDAARAGDHLRAESIFASLLDLPEADLGLDAVDRAAMLRDAGNTALELGKLDAADGIYRRALAQAALTRWSGDILHNLGTIALLRDRPDEAVARFRDAVAACRASRTLWPAEAAELAFQAAGALADREAPAAAIEFLDAAQDLYGEADDPAGLASTLRRRADVLRALGSYEEALRAADGAAALLIPATQRDESSQTAISLAEVLTQRADLKDALGHFAEALHDLGLAATWLDRHEAAFRSPSSRAGHALFRLCPRPLRRLVSHLIFRLRAGEHLAWWRSAAPLARTDLLNHRTIVQCHQGQAADEPAAARAFFADAAASAAVAIPLLRRHAPDDPLLLGLALNNRGYALARSHAHLDEAERCLLEARSLLRGEDDLLACVTHSAAWLDAALGDLAAAEAGFRAAHAHRLPHERSLLALDLEALAAICAATARPAEAAAALARALEHAQAAYRPGHPLIAALQRQRLACPAATDPAT